MRIRLLDALREGPATVRELQEATGASQQNVSKHLGVLLRSGMVSRTQGGQLLRATRSPTRACSTCASRSAADCAASSTSSTRRSREEPGDERPACSRPEQRTDDVALAAGARAVRARRQRHAAVSVALAALVSPWFLLLTAFVGVNQWLYVLFGACPASLILGRRVLAALRSLSARGGRPMSATATPPAPP